MLLDGPRGVPRVNDRRVLNEIVRCGDPRRRDLPHGAATWEISRNVLLSVHIVAQVAFASRA
jgi:hypothetical protein